MGRTDDVYSRVDVTIHQVTSKAIRISGPEDEADVWVPRSLLHGGDDQGLEDLDLPHEFSQMQIRKWFCLRKGLI